ncbi:MAG: DsbA family oxidoreductase [Bacteroidia bacterium]
MKIEIWSDVMCPFCYIGKRHFEKALEQFPGRDRVTVEWKSFQLNPDLVTQPEKNSIQHLAEAKGWTMDYAREMTAYVTDMARQVGLTYHLDKAVTANSFDAHRLSHLAKEYNVQDAVEELLFKAYFTEGKNTADHEVLTQIGVAAGMDAARIQSMLTSDEYSDDVRRDFQTAQLIGIRGVPFFVIDRQYGISGAQPVSTFLLTLMKAQEETA